MARSTGERTPACSTREERPSCFFQSFRGRALRQPRRPSLTAPCSRMGTWSLSNAGNKNPGRLSSFLLHSLSSASSFIPHLDDKAKILVPRYARIGVSALISINSVGIWRRIREGPRSGEPELHHSALWKPGVRQSLFMSRWQSRGIKTRIGIRRDPCPAEGQQRKIRAVVRMVDNPVQLTI